jgi:class 3 adenylate cyclase/tetratricopeptide (TPR) repeat protein
MAFVDVSGFTPLSERLATKGRVGAEDVTEVMNATFARLLDVAYAYGGGLLKFGGDALLLFFTGDQHAARACRASFGMRKALRALGPVAAPGGRVTLRMHVAVHSGAFDFFLVGDSHRELLIGGPQATRIAELEDIGDPGEILLSPETAAHLEARDLGEERGGGIVLAREPTAPERAEPLPPTEGLELDLGLPVALREFLEAERHEPEHRQAAVAFIRFGGLDGLLAAEGPEDGARRLETLVEIVQAACSSHGVTFLETDIDRDGGRIVLVAGAPTTAGDDEGRLLRTVREIADRAHELPLQIGVNRGRVFAGEVGAEFRRTYTILGDTAALAARLMARAKPGQILVAEAALERSRARFDSTALEPFLVKGKSRPVLAHDLGAAVGGRALEAPSRLPMVDRQRELAVLGASLAPARAGFGTLVELVGETGIGKTRLVEELREQCADMKIISGGGEPYGAATAYGAFRPLLRGLLGIETDAGDPGANTGALSTRLATLAPELVPWIPLLAVPLDLEVLPTREVDDLAGPFRRARLHGVVASLLEAVLDGPALVVLEDAHWLDDASSELLRHLGERVTGKHWFVCITRSPEDGGFSAAGGTPPLPALTMRLEPLPAEDAKTLVAVLAATLPAHEVDAIVERAGGNPLFIQELVRGTQDSAHVDELPESVEALVTARIDALAPGDRTLLRWASVLGLRFAGALVGEVLADDATAAAGSEAWDRLGEFVERDPDVAGAFHFRQTVFRDAAYDGLSFRRRRELHLRVAEVLEGRADRGEDEDADLLSLHFSRGGDHERTWRWSLAAGREAQAKRANVEAAAFYRRALDAARRLPALSAIEVAGVWEALGDVCELAGLYADAAGAYRAARRIAEPELGPRPGLMRKEGVIRERTGRYAEALRRYSRALAVAETLPDADERRRHRVELKLDYAGVRFRQGLFRECIRWCRDALDDAHRDEDLGALAHAYYLLHVAYTSIGSPEREAFRGLALPIYEELGDLLGQANVLNNLGIDAYYEGRWDEALELYGRSREARERIGDVVGAATIANNIAEILSDQGHLEAAETLFREAHDTCEAAGYTLICHVATSNLGRLSARAGRREEARERLGAALAGFREIHAASFELETEVRLAEASLLSGDYEDAWQRAGDALAQAAPGEAGAHLRALLQRLRGWALLGAGDGDGARDCLEASLAIATEAGTEYELALTLRALETVETRSGASDRAKAIGGEATALLERLGVVATPDVPLPTRALDPL